MPRIIQSVPLNTETGISIIILPLAGGPLLRVATIRHTTDTHYRHIPLHFSHNERTPVQISLQYLQCRVRQRVGHTVLLALLCDVLSYKISYKLMIVLFTSRNLQLLLVCIKSICCVQETVVGFIATSQNCGKRLLASTCLSVRHSVHPHGTAHLSPERIFMNFDI